MFDYILSLGGTVFVPIIMIVIGLIFRIPRLQAIKAGVTVGIGFVGMGLVIVMAIDSLSPPIKVMIERFGWPCMSLTLAQALPPALVMRQPLAP